MLQNQYKLDDGESATIDCFPIRKIFKGGYQSAGHWVKAEKGTKDKVFQVVIGPKPVQSPFPKLAPVEKPADRPPKPTKETVLDANFLMYLHFVDRYSDLCAVNISDQGLCSVKEEDFKLFNSVVYVNAAENHLSLEPFRWFPAIRELDLSLNELEKLQLDPYNFPYLEVLNLSYNKLSSNDILTLGLLPQLKILHLTGNDLDSLPPDLTIPYDPLDWLKYLNLDQNSFTGIPYLQQMESSMLKKPEYYQRSQPIIRQLKQPIECAKGEIIETFHSDINVNGILRELTDEEKEKMEEKVEEQIEEKMEDKIEEMEGQQAEETEDTETETEEEDEEEELTEGVYSALSSAPSLTAFPVVPGIEGGITLEDLLEPPKVKPMCFLKQKNEFLPPFSELRHLSLAKNQISDDEELLAVCLFPALIKLTIYKNPLLCPAKQLLVLSMFEDRLGIEVIRKKPGYPQKPPVIRIFNQKRKVDSHIPKIPKYVPMLETAEQLLGMDQVEEGRMQDEDPELETPTSFDICTELMSSTSHFQIPCKLQDRSFEGKSQTLDKEKGTEGFFITQVDDVTLNGEDVESLKERQIDPSVVTTNFPEKYRGYEELLDAKTDPDFVEPIGIQQNVQQLERSLRKLQLYPDPFARINLEQKPYVSKERKLRSVAEFTSHKSKADQMEAILKNMREQRAKIIIPLAHVLRGKGISKKDYEEAVQLLKDLQLKYQEARERLTVNFRKLQETCEEPASEINSENLADKPDKSQG
ncbi:X-ray radiation resistance-associated protein 1 isoform X2 [Scyliorhinus canicula]|uniref:X-ray radiation resistance-associated protein 1 isoform X2 n=1 Tax=Scyliorhinus canicula TaxID=7830 RepID=UPI0018F36FC6|nr:X-ray radiation resistance-associated protein 1 isoform X2 [Scyliorhinus canicula]